MQPERIEKVKFLASAALSRPPHERDSYLAQSCGGDAALRAEVDYYLNHGDKTEQFFYGGETVRITDVSADAKTEAFSGGLPTDPRVGKIFGKYMIQKRLAEGGMGIVYVALDTQLGREVALKVLPEFFSHDHERLQRFQREARATSLLNHPNIVTVYDLGHIDGCEYIVTEFVEGETLREKMTSASIPFVEMLKIASQVAGALAAAHKAGIIHRDIKPENIMLRPDGYVKVLDFGLAKLTDATRKSISGDAPLSQQSYKHTMPGTIMGTVAYMSPEQAEGVEVDARTDIWGLGVLLYEMAAGKLPFEGPTASHTIVAILEQTPDPIDHVSTDLQRVISTALLKDKTLRYQTAEAMSTALDELKHKLGYISDQNVAAATTHKLPITLAAMPPVRSRSYNKLLWIIPAVLAVPLILTLGILGVMTLLTDSGTSEDLPPPVNSVTPMPTATTIANAVVQTASPTPTPVYVEPTPAPTIAAVREDPPPRKKQPVTEPPVRIGKPPQEIKRPRRKKRDSPPDPNCVFTNSCR